MGRCVECSGPSDPSNVRGDARLKMTLARRSSAVLKAQQHARSMRRASKALAETQVAKRHATNVQNLLIVLAYYIVGALFFCNVEGWTIIQSVYFTTVTITTVGYGDFSPSTMGGARPSSLCARRRRARYDTPAPTAKR